MVYIRMRGGGGFKMFVDKGRDGKLATRSRKFDMKGTIN
jgi:hypothetical protein